MPSGAFCICRRPRSSSHSSTSARPSSRAHRHRRSHLPLDQCYRSVHLPGGHSRFVLSTSGHIAALVNPPGNPKSSFRVADDAAGIPEQFLDSIEATKGSWWTDFVSWPAERSGPVVSRARGAPHRTQANRSPRLLVLIGLRELRKEDHPESRTGARRILAKASQVDQRAVDAVRERNRTVADHVDDLVRRRAAHCSSGSAPFDIRSAGWPEWRRRCHPPAWVAFVVP